MPMDVCMRLASVGQEVAAVAMGVLAPVEIGWVSFVSHDMYLLLSLAMICFAV